MPITERLILPVDVTLVPVAELTAGMRARLKAKPGDYALARPRGRASAKLVSAESATLLAEFRKAIRVVEAVSSYAAPRALDAEQVLTAAFPLLRDCFNDRYLIPEFSPDAASILPTRERGDWIGPFEVLRLLQLRDDTELYQARGQGGELVAVKLVRPGRSADTGPMLAREAATLRQLGGAGAPRLVRQGRHAGRPWLALSWCVGVSPRVAFAELAARCGLEGRSALLDLVLRVARSYARLHRRGVLHGDVHPENLLIGRRGEVTILDFGLATPIPPLRLAGRAPRGAVAPYLAPEYAAALLEARAVPAPTRQSEVHDVGSLLYALLTGSPYAEFELDRDSMLRQILSEPPLPFSRRGVTPWPELEAVLARALAKQPEARYPSMTALVAALRQVPRPQQGARSTRAPEQAREQVVKDFLVSAREPASGPQPAPTGSVMLGAAGVAYALYRLACRRDDPEALALADVWLGRVEATASSPTAFTEPGSELVTNHLGVISPFHTVAGVRLVRALIALALGELHGAESAIAGFIVASRQPCDELDLTLGLSSTLLGCTLLAEAAGPSLPGAMAALRTLGNDTLRELWLRLESSEVERSGIAHGWGGILYASLRWSAAAGVRPPEQLCAALQRLAALAEPRGRGVRWAGPDAGEEVVGWCNGPAGLIQLWTLAHERFKRAEYAALAEASGWSAWEGRSEIPNLCCGLAGRAYGLLNLYQHNGAPEWLQRAEALADSAIAALRTPGRSWERPLSLFKGTPGIVLLAADLSRPEHAAMPFFAAEGWPRPAAAGHG
ncbi:MAG TPA: lanthionine synthetase LanC family protein [Gemmatimonadales bacterium]|nr:lanthionine synthetase LanC family protein [Gemmatimonadales bacterium]